jgi:hypothetical protein
MDIVNVRNARSIWLFDTRDLNPRGLSPVPFFFELKERYRFLGWPKTPEELSWTASSNKGIRFIDGTFSIEERLLAVHLTVYNDGIVADTSSSTRDSDAFIEDVLSFAAQHFGVTYGSGMVHRRLYASELIVRLSHDLTALCEKIGMLTSRLTELADARQAPFQWFGFELRQDPQIAGAIVPLFKLERELSKPAALNRYFSFASLPTESHEQLLNYLEKIFSK